MRGSTDTYTVTPEDDARINQLAQEKFAAWDAIYGKNPRFNLERTGRFPGGKLAFRLDVQRGVIRSASVWGDFFSTLSAEAITGALTGCRYDRAAVLDALRKNGIDGAVYQISLSGQFMRVSKSTILNLDQIYAVTKSISNCQIKFHDSYKTVYVSRRYYRDLNERLKERRALS